MSEAGETSEALRQSQFLLERGRPAEALRVLVSAMQETPDDPLLHAQAGLCWLWLGQVVHARRAADEALRLGAGLMPPHYVVAAVFRQQAAENAARRPRSSFEKPQHWTLALGWAEDHLREGLRIEPESVPCHASLAWTYLQGHRWRDAEAAARAGLAIAPHDLECARALVQALLMMRRLRDADEVALEALAQHPEDAAAHAHRGWVLLHRGQTKQALEHFRESMRQYPDSAWARLGLVEALKGRHFVYRVLLGPLLWLESMPERGAAWGWLLFAMWLLLAGVLTLVFTPFFFDEPGGVVFSACMGVTIAIALSPLLFLVPAMAVGLRQLFQVSLLFHPLGRHALTRNERMGAWLGVLLVAYVALAVMLSPWTPWGWALGVLVPPLALRLWATTRKTRRLSMLFLLVGVGTAVGCAWLVERQGITDAACWMSAATILMLWPVIAVVGRTPDED